MPIEICSILGIVLALIGAVLSMIFITPKKARAKLPPFLKFVSDFLNFKFLIIESILKALYIFCTLYCIFCGFFLLFGDMGMGFVFVSSAGLGLGTMLLGPVVVRIVYEFALMLILAVKNIIEINNKLKNQNPESGNDGLFSMPKVDFAPKAPAYQQPMYQQPQQQAPVAEDWGFCGQCGTKYNKAAGKCPNCGK
jgi:hypothetical protein